MAKISFRRAANRRRDAAAWVQQLTGQALDASSDLALRRRLRDGALLCTVLHHLKPGILATVSALVGMLRLIRWLRSPPSGAAVVLGNSTGQLDAAQPPKVQLNSVRKLKHMLHWVANLSRDYSGETAVFCRSLYLGQESRHVGTRGLRGACRGSWRRHGR